MLRLVLSPRWILWHLLTLGAMVSCVLLSAWQWGRAGSAMGSALNVGYGLQWPMFAVFFGLMWWHFLRLELREIGAAGPGPADPEPIRAPLHGPDPSAASPFGPRPADAQPAAIDEDSRLAAYNRMLAQLAKHDPED